MKQLLYKELRLVIPRAMYLLLLLSALLLVPNYPYMVGVSYVILMLFSVFNAARANNDHMFTAMLPVPRNHIVLAKHITVGFLELAQLVVAVPFALISSLVINPGGNLLGMDANVAFFGFALAAFSVYNLIFLPWYFKTGYKCGIPTLFALLGYVAFFTTCELIVGFVPAIRSAIDSLAPANVVYQLPVLAVGLLLFAAGLYVSYRLSVKNFERVSL